MQECKRLQTEHYLLKALWLKLKAICLLKDNYIVKMLYLWVEFSLFTKAHLLILFHLNISSILFSKVLLTHGIGYSCQNQCMLAPHSGLATLFKDKSVPGSCLK